MPDPSKLTMDDARRIFEKYPVDTSCHFGEGAAFESRYIEVARCIPEGATVLDVGCNTGGMGRRLIAEKGCTVDGVEPNRDLGRQARGRGYRTVYDGMIEDVCITETYDAIVCMGPIEHALDLDTAMAAMVALLKEGGVMAGDTVHRRGRWEPESHPNVMRAWDADSLRYYLGQWLQDVRTHDGYADGRSVPDFVFWWGVK